MLSNTAHNIANINTDGYRKTTATIVEDTNSLPRLSFTQPDIPGAIYQEYDMVRETSNVDLAEEFTRMMICQRGYQANIRAFKAQMDTFNSVIDILV